MAFNLKFIVIYNYIITAIPSMKIIIDIYNISYGKESCDC